MSTEQSKGGEAHRSLGIERSKAQGWGRRVMEATASCQWEPHGYLTVVVPGTAEDRVWWHITRDLLPTIGFPFSSVSFTLLLLK